MVAKLSFQIRSFFILFVLQQNLKTTMNQEFDQNLPYIYCGICFKDNHDVEGLDNKLLLTSCAHITCDIHLQSSMFAYLFEQGVFVS